MDTSSMNFMNSLRQFIPYNPEQNLFSNTSLTEEAEQPPIPIPSFQTELGRSMASTVSPYSLREEEEQQLPINQYLPNIENSTRFRMAAMATYEPIAPSPVPHDLDENFHYSHFPHLPEEE